MKLSRRNFIKLAIFTGVSFSSLLTGCKKTDDISYGDLKGHNDYEIITYNMPGSDIEPQYFEIMLIYYKHFSNRWSSGISIYMWNPDGDDFALTDSYHTEEEAWSELAERYNILKRESAFNVLVEMYGPKENYTEEEIKEMLDSYSVSDEIKTYKKEPKS